MLQNFKTLLHGTSGNDRRMHCYCRTLHADVDMLLLDTPAKSGCEEYTSHGWPGGSTFSKVYTGLCSSKVYLLFAAVQGYLVQEQVFCATAAWPLHTEQLALAPRVKSAHLCNLILPRLEQALHLRQDG